MKEKYNVKRADFFINKFNISTGAQLYLQIKHVSRRYQNVIKNDKELIHL